jgi:hypothetical protein
VDITVREPGINSSHSGIWREHTECVSQVWMKSERNKSKSTERSQVANLHYHDRNINLQPNHHLAIPLGR